MGILGARSWATGFGIAYETQPRPTAALAPSRRGMGMKALVAMFATAGLFLASGQCATADSPVIRVTGEASLSVPPDQAQMDLGVVTEDANAGRAASLNATKQQAVMDELRKRFGDAIEVKTISYSITPRYRYPTGGGQREQDGYTARNVIRVETRALEKVGAILDAATSSGANQVDQLSFQLRDEEPVRAKALRVAASNARAKAQAIAEALDMRLGQVISVEESGVSIPPVQPQLRMMGVSAKAETPVEAGSLAVHAELTLSVEASP